MKIIKILINTTALTVGVFSLCALCILQPQAVETVEAKRESLDDLIVQAATAKALDPMLLKALISQESNFRVDATGEVVASYKRRLQPKHGSRADNLSRAHGLMQVMGEEAERRNIPWYHLYEPRVNLEVGATILSSCISTAKAKDKLTRIQQGLACYYSGDHQVTNKPQNGNPTIQQYVQQTLVRYLGYKL